MVNAMNKLCARRGGIPRVMVVLLALIAVMLVIIALPSLQSFSERSQKIACEQALAFARDGLIIDFFNSFQSGSTQDAMNTLDVVMPARPNICPSGGTVYLVRGANGIFEPICGLHAPDEKQRCRLNASRAKELLENSLTKAKKKSPDAPEEVRIALNGQPLDCALVDSAVRLRRGTATSNDYEGIVAFYGIAGEGAFPVKGVKAGELYYFIYADEDHSAVWRADDGWTGDAYQY